VGNIDAALSVVAATGVKLTLVAAPDYGMTPEVQALRPSAPDRQAVHDVVANQLNQQIEALAQAYQLPYIDLTGAFDAIFGTHDSLNSTLAIGDVDIQLQSTDDSLGSNPYAAFVEDGVHPHTTVQGILANLVMESLNVGYGANMVLFSEEELLTNAGLTYGGSDTLEAQIGPYSDYVVNYVPEPSTLALAGGALLALLLVVRRRAGAV
jgi:hypothetical protein